MGRKQFKASEKFIADVYFTSTNQAGICQEYTKYAINDNNDVADVSSL
jgi:hypothetical protein